MRTGARVLSLLAAPLNGNVLRALESADRSLLELRRDLGQPPATTLRHYLRGLMELGVVERRQEPGFPGSVSYGITRPGRELLEVRSILERWLRAAPSGPISAESTAARTVTKALADGWSAGIVRALAARPFTLTELSKLIPQISYPTLERRLTAMRLAGQLETSQEKSVKGTPYRATIWLRAAAAPLSAAIGWERRFASSLTTPPSQMDVEAILLLAVPLVDFPPDLSGSCRLAVELRNGSDLEYAGVVVTIREGRMVSCLTRLSEEADGWLTGNPLDWLRWLKGSNGYRMEMGGDAQVARHVANGLRGDLLDRPRVLVTSDEAR